MRLVAWLAFAAIFVWILLDPPSNDTANSRYAWLNSIYRDAIGFWFVTAVWIGMCVLSLYYAAIATVQFFSNDYALRFENDAIVFHKSISSVDRIRFDQIKDVYLIKRGRCNTSLTIHYEDSGKIRNVRVMDLEIDGGVRSLARVVASAKHRIRQLQNPASRNIA